MYTGVSTAFFHAVGNNSQVKDLLKILVTTEEIPLHEIFNMPSEPTALVIRVTPSAPLTSFADKGLDWKTTSVDASHDEGMAEGVAEVTCWELSILTEEMKWLFMVPVET